MSKVLEKIQSSSKALEEHRLLCNSSSLWISNEDNLFLFPMPSFLFQNHVFDEYYFLPSVKTEKQEIPLRSVKLQIQALIFEWMKGRKPR